MLILPSSVKVFLCTQPTDMRCGFNKLSMLAEHVMHQDPLGGYVSLTEYRVGSVNSYCH